MFKLLFSLLPFLLLESTLPAGDPPKEDPPKPDDVKFDAAQQQKVNDLIAAARKKAEEDTAAKFKTDADEAKKKADAEAQRKKDQESGEFEKVRTSVEAERDTIAAERDTIKSENEVLVAYFTADYTAALKDLPDYVKEFVPADDASFATKSEWLTKAKAAAAKYEKANPRGNGPNPKPGDNKPEIPSAVPITKMF
jgi:hypothetical protein